jgi:TonB-linked SusC/RagA family outer membrane protein
MQGVAASANSPRAANDIKISLNLRETRLKQVLAEIERQSRMSFFYSTSQINTSRIVSISEQGSLEEILPELFAGSDIVWQIKGKHILLKKKATEKLPTKVADQPLRAQSEPRSTNYLEVVSPLVVIKGSVFDSNREPLAGVSVVVKNTSRGTVTDQDGGFTIEIPAGSSVLVFSFVGYVPQEVEIGNRSTLEVNLETDTKALNEVVVVGYGTAIKRDVIGSVATVTGQEIRQVPSASFTAGMQGRAAGVNIRETSGTPGAPISVQVRGVNSIFTGVDPLWIIDGMPVYSGDGLGRTSGTVSQNPMSTINPNDIQSIEVLKDAAATAIYGSRGSNGVVIVTTKGGKKGKGKGNVNLDYSTGISNLTRSPESIGFANTSEWFQIMDIAKKNGGRGVFEPGDILNANFPTSISREDALRVNTNWFDYVLRQGNYQDANFSFDQGLEKGAIFASFNYRTDKALNVGNDFNRLTGRINVDLEPVKNLKTGVRLNVMYTNNYRSKTGSGNPGSSGGTVGGFGSAIQTALPWYPVLDPDDASGYWNPGAGNLALSSRRDLSLDNKKTYRALGNLYVEYALPWVDGLSIRGEAATDLIQDNSTNWISGTVINAGRTYVYEGAITRPSYNYNAYLKYNKTFNEMHSLTAVAGTESQVTSQYTREVDGRDPVGYNQELGSTSPGFKDNSQGFLGSERYLRSYFGRANYKLMDKYLLGVSLRRDGSSAFSENVRWGNFAALSAGWIISDEKFFTNLTSQFNLLKLRGSFGQTGNQNIPGNQNINILINSAGNRYGTPEILGAGSTISIGNRTITWEKTNSYDIALDFGLLENRISGTIARYKQNVFDMLLQISTPPSASIGSVYGNVGDMTNWGWEFNVSSVNVNTKGFKWTTTFNFSTNHNKILRLTPEMERQKGNTLFVGGQLGLYKMSEYAGIDPERGVHMIWEIDRDRFNETGEFVRTGRKIPFTDTNSTLNEVVLEDKSSIPTFFGGFNNNFTYKGFDLGVFFTFSGGNYLSNSLERNWTSPQNGYWMKKSDLLTNSWTTPGQTDARYPLLFMEGFAPPTTAWDLNAIDPNTGLKGWWKNPDINELVQPNARETYDKNGGRVMTKYLEKGDYLRLKTLTLGYNLPRKLTNSLHMENLRIFGSATNLLTFTKYTGFDPETAASQYVLPSLRVFSGGISVTF